MHQLTKHLESEIVASEQVPNGLYKIGELKGSGSFGSFHIGHIQKDINNKNFSLKAGDLVAMKFEKSEIEFPQLFLEYKYYMHLTEGQNVAKFIPVMYDFLPFNGFVMLVFELFGPSLLGMMRKMKLDANPPLPANIGTFSLGTVTQLMMQLVNIFEYVHDRHLLYRDIKPENFVIGLPDTPRWCSVVIIDFGFAKFYMTTEKDKDQYGREIDKEKEGSPLTHIPYVEGKPVAGTGRYVSVNNDLAREVSRRDDMESLLFMAIFMFKRELPWDRLPKQSNQAREAAIRGKMKETITPEELCKDMPPQFATFFEIIRKLDFEERPPYRRLMGILRSALTILGIDPEDGFYDWDKSHKPVSPFLRQ